MYGVEIDRWTKRTGMYSIKKKGVFTNPSKNFGSRLVSGMQFKFNRAGKRFCGLA